MTQTHPRCDALLPHVSRTFALPIQALPPQLRAAIQTAYLLCRLVDCVEDEPGLPHAQREALFNVFDEALRSKQGATFQGTAQAQQLGGTPAERALCDAAALVFADLRALPLHQQRAILPAVQEMSRGMRAFSKRSDAPGGLVIADTRELEEYCYFVAGTVGLLLDQLFGQQATCRLSAAQRPEQAVRFGVGLQLVNILKDVAEDAERQVCYLPDALLKQHQVSAASLLQPRHRAASLAVVDEVTALAWSHLREAAEYTRSWTGAAGHPVRAFCALPLLLAAETLRLIETGDGVLQPGKNPKISRRRVAAIVSAVQVARGERRMSALLRHHGLLSASPRRMRL